jgi:hypothetical protein
MNVEWKEGRTFRCLLTGDLSLAGTRYMFTKLGLKKLSMRDYLGVYSPLSHSSACLWTRRTP